MTRTLGSHSKLRAVAVLLAVAALFAACSDSQSEQPDLSTPANSDDSSFSEREDTDRNAGNSSTPENANETANTEVGNSSGAGAATSTTSPGSATSVTDPAPELVDGNLDGYSSSNPNNNSGSEPASNQLSSAAGDTNSLLGNSSLLENSPLGTEGSQDWLDGIDRFVTGPYTPFTNFITTDVSLDQRRPVAVKIGNSHTGDRPQTGLSDADIVYELLVEGVTRFLAVFHSDIPDKIGPVRSARSSDIDILRDLSVPYYINSGANQGVAREIRTAARGGVLVNAGAANTASPYARDRARPSPHNLYFYYDKLSEASIATLPGDPLTKTPQPVFDYGTQNPPSVLDASGVTVRYPDYNVSASHVWDAAVGGWVRLQDGKLHTAVTDAGLVEIAPANVVVLSMRYDRSSAFRRSPQAVSYDSGDALVLTNGQVHEALWERTVDQIGFRFTDVSGRPLTLSAGSTWLLLSNRSSTWSEAVTTLLTPSQGAQMLADARAAANPSPTTDTTP